MSEIEVPPGCALAADGSSYQIIDMDAFLAAVRPTIQEGLATIQDAPGERQGQGWHGVVTCSACPVQIEGGVDGLPFYFRARWDGWSLGIADTADGDAVCGPYAHYEEGAAEGGGEYDGSWMPYSEAWRHIESGIAHFRALRASAP